jgi:hypothetical protein
VIAFLRARLAEPGTLNSLAVALAGTIGAVGSVDAWQAVISLGIAALGAASALTPRAAEWLGNPRTVRSLAVVLFGAQGAWGAEAWEALAYLGISLLGAIDAARTAREAA